MKTRVALGLGLALGLLTSSARADRSLDLSLVNPTVDNYGMLAIERTQTPRQWEFGFAATLGYARGPLQVTLHDTAAGPANARRLVHDQLTLDLGASLGLWTYVTVAAALPVAAQWYDTAALGDPAVPATTPGAQPVQTGATGLLQGQPRQNVGPVGGGPRDPRLSLKARLPRLRGVGLGLLLTVTLPLGNAAWFLGDQGATFRPMLILDGVWLGERLRVAGNLGAIVRQQSTLYDPGRPQTALLAIGNELTWGAGASMGLHRRVALGLEALGTVPLGTPDGQSTADVLGVAYLYPSDRLRVIAGVGGGVIEGARADDVRAIVGLSWTPSPGGGLP